MRGLPRAALALLLGAAGIGCGSQSPKSDAAAAADSSAMHGLSREQIKEQVQPMSPARAESLGIAGTALPVDSPVSAAPDTSGGGL